MLMNSQSVTDVLSRLGGLLTIQAAPHSELVVCGGSALIYLGLIERRTTDVDVLAIADRDAGGGLTLRSAAPLPSSIQACVPIIARDLQLRADWLNSGPTQLLSAGLPAGMLDRLVERQFGSSLTVHFVGRFDQVCLKLYAVIDSGEAGRHLQDLRALKPTHDEIRTAVAWCLTQDASEVFPELARDCLRQIGYADVADSI
jgi:hypothetical protein